MRIIRQLELKDMTQVMQVMDAARGIMRSSGNMHQWTDGYPSEAVVLTDMKRGGGYVVEEQLNTDGQEFGENGRIIAYFAFLPSPELTYSQIYKGAWIDDKQPYHVIHRMASYPDVHGIFNDVMDFCFASEKNIRIDTHRDNAIMQHCIAEYGFTYCGIIYLANGDERLAYQKIM